MPDSTAKKYRIVAKVRTDSGHRYALTAEDGETINVPDDQLQAMKASGRIHSPAPKTNAELRAEYIAKIGYDPFADDPSITNAEVARTLAEYDAEAEREAGRPADRINGEELAALAKAARPLNEDDYTSERQESAWNAFFNVADKLIPPGKRRAFDLYCLKADPDEIIDEAMRLIASQRGR